MLSRVARVLTRPPLRAVAAPAYAAAIAAQLAVHRALDRLGPRSGDRADDLTALIKTFERPRTAMRLVASIRRLYPTLAIVLVDDSRVPLRLDGVETLALPYDSGLSAGRNAGLARVRTPFVLLLDDDFVFYRGTALGPTLRAMRAHPELDLVGGDVVDLPTYRTIDTAHRRALGSPRGAPIEGTIAGLPRREVVRNFFVARTAEVAAIGWDPELKLVEHADFFGRARGVLTIAHDARLRVLHAKTPFDARYMAHRTDVAVYQARVDAKWAGRG